MKVAIRLLLLEDLLIDDLGKITAMQDNSGKYHFFKEKANVGKIERAEIEIDAGTAKIAIPLLRRNRGKLVKGNRRNFAHLFQRWSDKLHFDPNITTIDLRKFGRGLHPDDIRIFVLD